MSTRINQDGTVIHYSVTIFGDTVFSRHFIIGHAARRQVSANSDLTVVSVRLMPLTADIRAETRTRVVSNATSDGANRSADSRSDWASYDGAANSARRGSRCGALSECAG